MREKISKLENSNSVIKKTPSASINKPFFSKDVSLSSCETLELSNDATKSIWNDVFNQLFGNRP